MEGINVFSSLDFSKERQETAYKMLREQEDNLSKLTGEVLRMEIESIDSLYEPERGVAIPVALYVVYVVCPRLGNFRRKIFTVIEGKAESNFPVDISCHIDNKTQTNVSKEDFLKEIESLLARPLVKRSIEQLYIQSVEA